MVYQTSLSAPRSLRAVFMSRFVPRECGLATFTEDVLNSVIPHGVRCSVVAMNRPRQHFAYDQQVITIVQEDQLSSYLAAAELINQGGFDVLKYPARIWHLWWRAVPAPGGFS